MVRPASSKSLKRKRPETKAETPKARKSKALTEELDEDIPSDMEASEGEESDRDDRETPAQKRVRLARQYLDQLEAAKRKGNDEFDAEEIDKDYISQRLQEQVLADAGKVYIHIGKKLQPATEADVTFTSSSNGHRLPLTAAVLSQNCKWLYTASKDGSILKWAVKQNHDTKRTLARVKAEFRREAKGKQPEQARHSGEIYALALTDDGAILASAGADKLLGVWSTAGDALDWRKGLKSHKEAVTALAFRKGSTQCYTASFDRTVKIYDLAPLTFIDTLFGHQERILDLSVLKAEVAVTAGGSDKSVRYFKVADESQLVFRGGGMGSSKLREVIEGTRAADELSDDEAQAKARKRRYVEGSIECVSMVENGHFLSGGNSGTISLWSTGKKKPVFTYPVAHGVQEGKPRWITAIAALPFSDVFATGSWDGRVTMWTIDQSFKNFKKLFHIPLPGVVNALQLVQDPSDEKRIFLAAALGQEPRLGRWFKVTEGKNRAAIVELRIA